MVILQQDLQDNPTQQSLFELLFAEISTRFVNLPAEQIDAQIEDAQRLICECLKMDLSALWQWSDTVPSYMTVTHFYTLPDGPPRPENIDSREAFPFLIAKVLRGELLAHSTEDLPPEAERDKETLRYYGIKSSVDVPLSTGGGAILGILSFDTLRAERSWPEATVRRLQLVAQLFANALERKRSEKILRESEARLTLAADSAQAGLWELNFSTRVFWVTDRARTLFDFSPEEIISMERFEASVHPDDLESVRNAIAQSLDEDKFVNVEYRIRSGDGYTKWISSRGRACYKTTGEPDRLMGVSIDISSRKQLEGQLLEKFKEIEGLKQQLEKENLYLRQEIELKNVHEEIVGRSPAMNRILASVEQVARTDSTVLIEGETGTGKELLARAVHRLSARNDRPLVTVNCASLPPTLIEGELFGREKGAYTGALTRMTGRFEVADGATLFLDEIGELPYDVQAKLLRVLEEGRFERLGSTKSLKVDVRIIAATNKNLLQEVSKERFRKDLYYRLHVFPIVVPPLRERLEDIPLLVWAFVRQYEKKMGKRIDHIPRKSMETLQRYSWPGNARELRNVVEHAMIVNRGKTLEVCVPQRVFSETPADLNLEDIERRHVLGVLEQTGWRLGGENGAAAILGLKRTTLQSKMKKLGIQRPTR